MMAKLGYWKLRKCRRSTSRTSKRVSVLVPLLIGVTYCFLTWTIVRKFKIFNTNNLWINLRALKRIMEQGEMELDIIINPKTTDDGQAVIQVCDNA